MKSKMKVFSIIFIFITVTVFGFAKINPFFVQGDPIPGIDVSIEQSPGGIIIATTQSKVNGVAIFNKITPGKYIVKMSDHRQASNYNTSKLNIGGIASGANILNGSLNFTKGKPGKALIEVTGTKAKTIEFFAKEGPGSTEPVKTGEKATKSN